MGGEGEGRGRGCQEPLAKSISLWERLTAAGRTSCPLEVAASALSKLRPAPLWCCSPRVAGAVKPTTGESARVDDGKKRLLNTTAVIPVSSLKCQLDQPWKNSANGLGYGTRDRWSIPCHMVRPLPIIFKVSRAPNCEVKLGHT